MISDLRFHRLDFDDSGCASCTPGATWCQCCTGFRAFQCWNLPTKGMKSGNIYCFIYSVEFQFTRLTFCLVTTVELLETNCWRIIWKVKSLCARVDFHWLDIFGTMFVGQKWLDLVFVWLCFPVDIRFDSSSWSGVSKLRRNFKSLRIDGRFWDTSVIHR